MIVQGLQTAQRVSLVLQTAHPFSLLLETAHPVSLLELLVVHGTCVGEGRRSASEDVKQHGGPSAQVVHHQQVVHRAQPHAAAVSLQGQLRDHSVPTWCTSQRRGPCCLV